jgi:glycerophosphoryl diester phosphodiesterase
MHTDREINEINAAHHAINTLEEYCRKTINEIALLKEAKLSTYFKKNWKIIDQAVQVLKTRYMTAMNDISQFRSIILRKRVNDILLELGLVPNQTDAEITVPTFDSRRAEAAGVDGEIIS